jgi:hypothetical protein
MQASAEVESSNAERNQQMADRIAKALSSASLNDYDIEVRYKDGVAMLSGSVANPKQLQAATQVVSRVPGVQQVDNQLQLESPTRQASVPPTGPNGQPMISPAMYNAMAQPGMLPAPGATIPPSMAYPSPPPGTAYDQPQLPEYAWPAMAAYPNYAQVAYPTQYSASAWPYIGPFYPYPQVPLGWREAQLEWDDGYWQLNFRPRTERWYWFLHPKNW